MNDENSSAAGCDMRLTPTGPSSGARAFVAFALATAALPLLAAAQVAVNGALTVSTGASPQTWYGNVTVGSGGESFTITGNLTIAAPAACVRDSDCASSYCGSGTCGMRPPQIAITGITNGAYLNYLPVSVCYTVTDPFLVTAQGTLDGTPFSGCASAYTESSHTVMVTATNAGGSAASAQEVFTVDLTRPAVSVVSPSSGVLVGSPTVAVTASASDLNGIAAVQVGNAAGLGGLSLGLGADGFFHGTIPLDEGSNALTVTAIDVAGNPASTSSSVTRDTTAPTLTVTAPADGAVVTTTTVVTGTVVDANAVSVTVNGLGVTVGSNGAFWTTMQLANGANTVTVRATDAVLNTTTVTRNVQVGQGAIYYCYDGTGNMTARLSCPVGQTCEEQCP